MQLNLFQRIFSYFTVSMRVCLGFLLGLMAIAAQANVPPSERDALDQLWNVTNGNAWTNSTNWNDPQKVIDVCTRYGIVCNIVQGVKHVSSINLPSNNLNGQLPATLFSALPYLRIFKVEFNQLTGSIPALTGLTNLYSFDVSHNQLIGSIPALTGLTNLWGFSIDSNQLTGSIPVLTGLTNLQIFSVLDNQLTGSIPDLAGLANLYSFDVSHNQLTGLIPDLAGLANLYSFGASNNQLIGSIPVLTGSPDLGWFSADSNQLIGSIPVLTGLARLQGFFVSGNRLTGSIPDLSGLTYLERFSADSNQLTGSIPVLTGLTNLQFFYVNANQLTGSVPDSTDTDMHILNVAFNQLSGPAPTPPNRNSLIAGYSILCPNKLDITYTTYTAEWDAATGAMAPKHWWYFCEHIFIEGFEGP